MQCSKEEALASLFYSVSSSFTLLLLLYHFSSIIISNLLSYLPEFFPVLTRLWHEPENTGLADEDEDEESYGYFYGEGNDLVADVVDGGDSLLFLPSSDFYDEKVVNFLKEENEGTEEIFCQEDGTEEILYQEDGIEEILYQEDGTEEILFQEDGTEEILYEEDGTEEDSSREDYYERAEEGFQRQISEQYDSQASESEYGGQYSVQEEDVQVHSQNSDEESEDVVTGSTDEWSNDISSQILEQEQESGEEVSGTETNHENVFIEEETFLVFQPPKSDSIKKVDEPKQDHESNKIVEETVFGDSCTNASTSKSSTEWRSSIFCRDSVSGTEDPFSSSSRRSCPKWESYAIFQKYDEEMLFFDRISAQKLHETEALKSIQYRPRSVSDRIIYKLTNQRPSKNYRRSYEELEAAYVAQICLTWEALNWNYIKFRAMLATIKGDNDPGCPAHIAQQFQQFQVLLQRYVENEPFEHGKRPEIYARIRISAPKLLQVPEYRDSDDEQIEDEFKSRISSPSFLMIMEDGIRTFMNFLKGDKKKHCQIITSFFSKNKRGLVDPSLLHIVKKSNQKKKMKLKEMRHPRICLRKIKLKPDEEMLILMGLIDLKIVSRVLRMADLNTEQLHWCEQKMGKVRIWEGKLQRDSSPLFFPASSH